MKRLPTETAKGYISFMSRHAQQSSHSNPLHRQQARRKRLRNENRKHTCTNWVRRHGWWTAATVLPASPSAFRVTQLEVRIDTWIVIEQESEWDKWYPNLAANSVRCREPSCETRLKPKLKPSLKQYMWSRSECCHRSTVSRINFNPEVFVPRWLCRLQVILQIEFPSFPKSRFKNENIIHKKWKAWKLHAWYHCMLQKLHELAAIVIPEHAHLESVGPN